MDNRRGQVRHDLTFEEDGLAWSMPGGCEIAGAADLRVSQRRSRGLLETLS